MPDNILNGNIIDLDLDKEDAALREAIGQPTRVRMRGVAVEFQHPSLWTSTAMKAVNNGDWHAWGQEVIDDPAQYKHFVECNLRNFQYEAIFKRLNKDAGVDLGKLKEPGNSSPAIVTT
jgi:hypothetical protein